MNKPLPKADLQDLHSILRRAAERAERNKQFELARKLAEEIANIDLQMAVTR